MEGMMLHDGFRIADAPAHAGKEVVVRGWVRHLRSSGSIHFLEVRDGTGEIQAVAVKAELEPEIYEECAKARIECALEVKGVLREEKRAPGGYELTVRDLKVLNASEEEYPLSKKSHGTDFLMENRHLWLRSRRQLVILRIRSELIALLRRYFHDGGYTLIDTPILTGSIGESAGNLFETEYFDFGKAYLAQTGQLYLEAAASAFGKVFCFGPTFRAEKSKTRRHLTEFWMLEAEVAYYDTHRNMDLQEDMIASVVDGVLTRCEKDLLYLERDLEPLKKIKPPFPRITYTEALDLINKKGFSVQWGEDIGGDEETALSESFASPVFVTEYPAQIKAFYMKPNPEDRRTVLNDDLLAPEGYGEIIGGSQRNDDYDSLVRRIKESGLKVDSYAWYLDIRKFGSVPHAGFGLGLERLLSWICRLPHVREAIPFPRLINRLYP
jgi:asparaginyl-tRNA synthetase